MVEEEKKEEVEKDVDEEDAGHGTTIQNQVTNRNTTDTSGNVAKEEDDSADEDKSRK